MAFLSGEALNTVTYVTQYTILPLSRMTQRDAIWRICDALDDAKASQSDSLGTFGRRRKQDETGHFATLKGLSLASLEPVE
jgi:hypothetical protein